MTIQSPQKESTKEQIVSEIVEETKAFLSFFALLLFNSTFIWYIVNNTMEYPVTWQFVFGALLVLRFIKL
jgi:hypothetical protein